MLVKLPDDERADEKNNVLVGKQLVPANLLKAEVVEKCICIQNHENSFHRLIRIKDSYVTPTNRGLMSVLKSPVLLKGTASAVPEVLCLQWGFSP